MSKSRESARKSVIKPAVPSRKNTPAEPKPTAPAAPATHGLAAKLTTGTAAPALVPHLVIDAKAGTGKTTTLVEALKRLRGMASNLTPSPQQAAIWDCTALSRDARTVCFVAFNKSIATELQERVPSDCQAMTMHSMGMKAVNAAFASTGRLKVNQYRVQDLVSAILEMDIREIRKKKPQLLKATEELVGLCKMNLVGLVPGRGAILEDDDPQWAEQLDELCRHYEVECNGSRTEVFKLVPKVLAACANVTSDMAMDFDDMVWLPVALDLPVFKYGLLLVDEAQDLNRCQQELAKKAGHRLILCGDPQQAIYGFAGADARSMARMVDELSATPAGCVVLPLNMTRRCGKAIVREAQKIVPAFEAYEGNPEGVVSYAIMGKNTANARHYHQLAQEGDMVLCRVNAPLVSECFRFLRAGRKANIQGRDVGQGLISTINKLKAIDVADLVGKLSDWLHTETQKEQAKRIPNEGRIINLQDRHDCLVCFTEGVGTVEGVIRKIETVFTDDKKSPGIKLSSIHKAKGLEAKRVFLLEPKKAPVPHPMAKGKWQIEQEWNLRYVAITRAIEEICYVSEDEAAGTAVAESGEE
jgi:DNA helicase-2/ATP-dependent DNA helicase PcrA